MSAKNWTTPIETKWLFASIMIKSKMSNSFFDDWVNCKFILMNTHDIKM